MHFHKLSGAGNDFVAFDNRDGHLMPDDQRPAWLQRLCTRGTGVGADGVLILENSDEADIRMRYHNADGGESEMCGNGLRSLARLAHTLGAVPEKMTVKTGVGIHRAEILDERRVRVTITEPSAVNLSLAMPLDDRDLIAASVNTGVPHVVLSVADFGCTLDALDVTGLGRRLRHHPAVMPAGANVNFFERHPSGGLRMRTYERGVEAETLACGTGATATAIALALSQGLPSPISLEMRSGEALTIHFDRTGDRFTNIWLEGPAVITYEGNLAPALLP